MMIIMERAQTLVARNSETESLGDPLNGEVAELLQFVSFHFPYLLFRVRLQILLGLRIEPGQGVIGDELAEGPQRNLFLCSF